MPPDKALPGVNDHAGRVAAMTQFLFGLCGDYAPRRRHFIQLCLNAVAAHLRLHHAGLGTALKRYHGLYVPDDWIWSALRPLPRACLCAGAEMPPVNIAFWDRRQAVAIDLAAQNSDRTAKRKLCASCCAMAILPDGCAG